MEAGMKLTAIMSLLLAPALTLPADAMCIFGLGDCTHLRPAQVEATTTIIAADIVGMWAEYCKPNQTHLILVSAKQSEVPLITDIVNIPLGGSFMTGAAEEEIESASQEQDSRIKIVTRNVTRSKEEKTSPDFGKIREYYIIPTSSGPQLMFLDGNEKTVLMTKCNSSNLVLDKRAR
jgi:hypothetical protein